MPPHALLVDTAYFEPNSTDLNGWIVDCGATKHCTPCMSDLCVVTNPRPKKKIRVGNGKLLQVTAIGKVRMEVATSGGYETMELSNVYVVPEMKCRLLSSNWAWQHDNVSTHLNNDRFLRLPYLRRKSCATFASPELEVLKGEGSKTGRARRKRVAHGHVREAGRCLFQL